MRNKNFLFIGLLTLSMLSACSNENEPEKAASAEGESYAQISIQIASSDAMTKAFPDENNTGDEIEASTAENKVSNLLVILADANNIAQQIIKPELESETSDLATRQTKAFKVNVGSYKVYVLANYDATALSPIVMNSTDMKSVFTISTFSKLTDTSNGFLMANDALPGLTDINASTEAAPQNISVNIERVVSKVTFDGVTTTTFEVNEAGTKIASATINGVSLINLNKKMFLMRDKAEATNKPNVVKNKWYYPEDPNYSTMVGILTDNFDKATATNFTDFTGTPLFYCPENTMAAASQKNGQTTGVVYKVTYTPESDAYTKLDQNGTDAYSAKFALVLEDDGAAAAGITSEMFTTPSSSDFYTYNGFIFKNKNAATLYKVIAADASDDAKTIIAAFTAASESSDVHKYDAGVCYYPVWIKHNPDGTIMQQDKYGTVRNHWYVLKVNNIKKLGSYQPTYTDSETPDDEAEAFIDVTVKINKWVLVKQEVDLE